ncbi:tRNA dihydrouridine synthase DusB [Cellulomonas fimi]|uniref:TIM-barrel protein, nifR3 family n=1 Tax=Cellulomonas fimi (strain ATCC 484 / DSM 20113 / JCM 1341 / CCUG 24087 / LMG 16345 / NBRC 15513 / NCIMB 8980 / NCTC 7547 / NRS-133) TaxID=590998 RepID=F4H2U8_CELFA|nr:tRNA dihydrouridine synthase DusB [Cellulomonas fimi]AEE46447.1 TIM-barrel protein, nifR3 family [Cellulomonas fimi ATCC 484]NNH07739.1 tRNA dihydrouridine synthase DusB [Cellulomonas fimi]VEH33039.1 Probable tRNA-dihydrouridine synthase [Cellulomonas fimi]
MTTTTPAAPARPGAGAVLPPLRIGPITVDTPVVLAPMAGVTNAAFRRLCRESGAGLYVAEMLTSRALVERSPESFRIISFAPDEVPRSVQVYGVDPATVGAAVRMLVEEDLADHVDLNFGCPVPKVTRRGGGAVLPWKRDLFSAIVHAAVDAARPSGVPVTVKMRKGIDEEHLTYVEAGLTAQDAGVAAVALHGRTAADYYSGTADWDAIATLKEAVTDIPVLGNGDIWSAEDALAMVAHTGCDGVVVGRGCQGRPWLFADLAAAFAGSDVRIRPGLGEVAQVVRRHAELMVEHFGDESKALREMRKHMAWYLKGYVVGGEARAALGLVSSMADLDDRLAALDLTQPYPGEAAEGQRGRAGSPKRPILPYGWLDSRELSEEFRRDLHEAELSVSGG